MFPYYYALEKLVNAVRILAIGEGNVRSRRSAYLEFHTLQIKDIPPHIHVDYEWILEELTKRHPRGWVEGCLWTYIERDELTTDGAVQFNLPRMINRIGSQFVGKICDLEYHIQNDYEKCQQNLGKQPK